MSKLESTALIRNRYFDELSAMPGLYWLGQNTNHIESHPAVLKAMLRSIEAGEFNAYAPPLGFEALRSANGGGGSSSAASPELAQGSQLLQLATAEFDKQGRVTSTEGTWQAGRNGAIPGIFFPANPKLGRSGRQEFDKGHAEDHFRILDLTASVSVPFVSTTHAMRTKEWTPLEPNVLDNKYYVRNVGLVREQTVQGGSDFLELVSVTGP